MGCFIVTCWDEADVSLIISARNVRRVQNEIVPYRFLPRPFPAFRRIFKTLMRCQFQFALEDTQSGFVPLLFFRDTTLLVSLPDNFPA